MERRSKLNYEELFNQLKDCINKLIELVNELPDKIERIIDEKIKKPTPSINLEEQKEPSKFYKWYESFKSNFINNPNQATEAIINLAISVMYLFTAWWFVHSLLNILATIFIGGQISWWSSFYLTASTICLISYKGMVNLYRYNAYYSN